MHGKNCSQNRYPIHRLIIEEGLKEYKISENVLKALPHPCPEYMEPQQIKLLEADSQTLILTRNKGKFLKPCPGTKEYLCCQYRFLNIGLNCPIDCTYCILQVYLNTDALVIYVNIEDMFTELASELNENPSLIRIGTGELTDSLALDHLTGLNPLLIDFFSRQKQGYLELKTKSNHIEHILALDHHGQTIISWSLNPQLIIDAEERLATSLQARIMAAQKCQERGYKIGFHFDPIILYKGWKEDYESVIDMLFSNISPKSIAWISMGCFRFIPALKGIIQKKYPKSRIIYEEFIPGMDKKMRYPQIMRVKIYSTLARRIRKKAPNAFIYLCMESPEVWKEAIGIAPDNNTILKSWLDERCKIKPRIS